MTEKNNLSPSDRRGDSVTNSDNRHPARVLSPDSQQSAIFTVPKRSLNGGRDGDNEFQGPISAVISPINPEGELDTSRPLMINTGPKRPENLDSKIGGLEPQK